MSTPAQVQVLSTESARPDNWTIDTYRYKPQNPALNPYWDAFYENPYPSREEYTAIAQKLGWSVDTVRRWFEEARRFTHAPEKEPSCDVEPQEPQGDGDGGKVEKVKIHGPLDSHFGGKDSELHNERPSKRDRSGQDNISHTEGTDAKKAKVNSGGPRGTYTKQSHTTLWRNKKHAQKYASNIQQFFPSTKRRTGSADEYIVIDDEPDSVNIASGSLGPEKS